MKVLILSPEMILPANTGGRIGIYNRVKALINRGHEVYVIITAKRCDVDIKYINELKTVCKHVEVCIREDIIYKSAVKYLITSIPYGVLSRLFEDKIRHIICDNKFDIIISEYPQMLLNLVGCKTKAKIVLEQHNIEYEALRSIAKSYSLFNPKKILYYIESLRMRIYEKRIIKSIKPEIITFVSQEDMERYDLCNKNTKFLASQGVDDYYSDLKNNKKIVTFVANFGYKPNIDAAKWAINNIVPEVSKFLPDVEFWFVGKNPDPKLIHLGEKYHNVIFTGCVENLMPYYQQTSIIIIPIFSGGGINIKTLEAASANRVIVATDFALKGTGLVDNVHVLKANTANQFSDKIINVFGNYEKYQAVIKNCYKFFRNNLSMDVVYEKWVNKIESICRK